MMSQAFDSSMASGGRPELTWPYLHMVEVSQNWPAWETGAMASHDAKAQKHRQAQLWQRESLFAMMQEDNESRWRA